MIIGILGCGYVGKAVGIALRDHGYVVYAATRKIERFSELNTFAGKVFVIGESLSSFMEEIDVLFVSVAPDSSSDYASTYLKTAENIAFNLPQAKRLKQIIYIGTTSVYKESEGNWVDETALLNEADEKARILIETEKVLLQLASSKLHVCVFRLGEITGPGREIKKRLIKMAGKPFAGDGSQYTNLITLEDIIKASFFAIFQKINGVFNLCNRHHISRKDFYNQICEKESLPSITWDPSLKNPHGSKKRISSAKIEKLGFEFSSQHFF